MLYSVEILYSAVSVLLNQGVYNTDHQSKIGYFLLPIMNIQFSFFPNTFSSPWLVSESSRRYGNDSYSVTTCSVFCDLIISVKRLAGCSWGLSPLLVQYTYLPLWVFHHSRETPWWNLGTFDHFLVGHDALIPLKKWGWRICTHSQASRSGSRKSGRRRVSCILAGRYSVERSKNWSNQNISIPISAEVLN